MSLKAISETDLYICQNFLANLVSSSFFVCGNFVLFER